MSDANARALRETSELRDQLAIRTLVYECADATDQGDAERFAACYTSDGVFERSDGVCSGRAAIAAVLRKRPPELKRRHVFANLRIDVHDAETASGHGYCLVFDHRDGEALGAPPIVADFFDEYQKSEGRWRISNRVVRRSFGI